VDERLPETQGLDAELCALADSRYNERIAAQAILRHEAAQHQRQEEAVEMYESVFELDGKVDLRDAAVGSKKWLALKEMLGCDPYEIDLEGKLET